MENCKTKLRVKYQKKERKIIDNIKICINNYIYRLNYFMYLIFLKVKDYFSKYLIFRVHQ